jgi:NADPH:quinone reductase-like Zn-dependent oxidoreductase
MNQQTSRRAVVRTPHGPESIEIVDVPVPEPGQGQVRVKVAAAAINPVASRSRAAGSTASAW